MGLDRSLFNDSMQMRDSSQQKRKKARVAINMPAEYCLAAQSEFFPCVLTDVGAGGLSMTCKGNLYQGDQVKVRFKLNTRVVEMQALVIRVNGKAVGLQYSGASEEQISAIQHFIHTTFFDKDKKKP